ncbi:MAG: hypothetical protein AB8B91_19770 [Rubripirellula sp.]
MHQLPCPSCQAPIPVSPSQAGDRTTCPKCSAEVDIPKLGELRQLPVEDSQTANPESRQAAGGGGKGFIFLALGMIGVVSLLMAGYCGIRWVLIDVPATSEIHIADYKERYENLTAAELVREYEDMEKFGVELAGPFKYKLDELKKTAWGGKAAGAGVVGLISIAGAFLIGGSGRRSPA